MKLRILPSALEDLAAGRRFYTRLDEKVGDYFFESLFADIDTLAKRFPYAIYYKLDEDTAIVWRVLDCRRKPAKTRQALK